MISRASSTRTVRTPIYRIPRHKYWAQNWNPWPAGTIATLQLLMIFGNLSMETGNALVDLFRSNVYSGYWSFPFTMTAVIATYACVCATRTQTKATIALGFQLLSVIVMLVVIGFLMAFIASSFKLCISFQCAQNSSTSYSNSTYYTLKQVFISAELACSVIHITLSIMYIVAFVKCFQKLPRVHPLVAGVRREATVIRREVSNISRTSRTSRTSRHLSAVSSTSHNRSIASGRTRASVLSARSYYGAQKICPNCKDVSPYFPEEDIVQCPRCNYQSRYVEHAQQG